MSEDANILDPDVELTLRGGERVTVRELNWRDGRRILAKLSEAAIKLVAEKGLENLAPSDAVRLVTENLADELIQLSTGKDAEWLGERTMGEVTRLLDAAVALNFRAENITAGKALAATLAAVAGRMTGSAALTTT